MIDKKVFWTLMILLVVSLLSVVVLHRTVIERMLITMVMKIIVRELAAADFGGIVLTKTPMLVEAMNIVTPVLKIV